MARKKKTENEIKEVDINPYGEILEVTEDFVIEDVSDISNTEELSNLEELNITEVEAAIEDGEKLELVEENNKPKPFKSNVITNSARQGRAPKHIHKKKLKPIERPSTNNGIKTTHGLTYN